MWWIVAGIILWIIGMFAGWAIVRVGAEADRRSEEIERRITRNNEGA